MIAGVGEVSYECSLFQDGRRVCGGGASFGVVPRAGLVSSAP